MVDIEWDGPIPGDYSMVCFGAVIVEPSLSRTFYGQLRPVSERWVPEALAVSGFSREEVEGFSEPLSVMQEFDAWVSKNSKGRPMFISDNNGFDWQFINWYFHHFLGRNPFGHSSTNLGSLYKGLVRDTWETFKHLRKTEHTHNPVDDAVGNAEALLAMKTNSSSGFGCERIHGLSRSVRFPVAPFISGGTFSVSDSMSIRTGLNALVLPGIGSLASERTMKMAPEVCCNGRFCSVRRVFVGVLLQQQLRSSLLRAHQEKRQALDRLKS